MRRTKIIATLGPATDNINELKSMLLAGVNVARFNLSHGDHVTMMERLTRFRAATSEIGLNVAALADTRGPEVRIGTFASGRAELAQGQQFILTTQSVEGDDKRVSVNYAEMPKDVSAGDTILVDDGLISLKVLRTTDTEVITEVENGGPLSDRKSVNVPSGHLHLPFISSKDRSDLRFIVDAGFDYIAASFTRTGRDIREMREALRRLGGDSGGIRIIAKIENSDGVNNMESIIDEADGVMVARGDLGVEMPLVDIPILQKQLIKRAQEHGKVVITATQMLESMISNPRPTRAEVSDVANAIFDGTSAIMLSGETAAGKHPVQAVRTMSAIAERTEREIDYRALFLQRGRETEPSVVNAIAHATVTTAHDLDAAAILSVTLSGGTARNIAKYRPSCPVIACTDDPRALRQLALEWGVTPIMISRQTSTDALFREAFDLAMRHGGLVEGDLVVLTAGLPLGSPGTTNMLKVHEVGDTAQVL